MPAIYRFGGSCAPVPRVAITTGDPAGIGPEIAEKAAASAIVLAEYCLNAAEWAVVDAVRPMPFVVSKVERRNRKKTPSAPFPTSTLQQEAAKKLGYLADEVL